MNARTVLRYLAVALCTAVALSLAACAQPQTIEPYQPGVGADTAVGDVALRALTIVMSDEDSGALTGALVARTDDTLTSLTGTALGTDLEPGAELTITADTTRLPAQTLVPLDKITVSGDGLVPGLNAELTFVFAEGGIVTVAVPIVAG